jgi:hypothetical protein
LRHMSAQKETTMCVCGGILEVGFLAALGAALLRVWVWLRKRVRK